MKELNIIEAMEMPIGTEFTIKPSIVNCSCPNVFINGDKGEKVLVLENKEIVPTAESILSAKFIPISKPVSFMEAIISENRIKVVIDNWEFSDVYMKPSEMLTRLGNVCDKWRIRIIKYGKWYIEE